MALINVMAGCEAELPVIQVDAEIIGPFGLHRQIDRNGKRSTLTHLGTGIAVVNPAWKKDLRILARELIRAKLDWDFTYRLNMPQTTRQRSLEIISEWQCNGHLRERKKREQ